MGSRIPSYPWYSSASTRRRFSGLIMVGAQGDRALAGNLFVQSAPYTTDRQLAADMKIQPYTIHAGKYKIQHEGKTAIVIFTVRKK